MRFVKKWALWAIAVSILFSSCVLASAEDFRNPLIAPREITEYRDLPEEKINILLVGIDFGERGYRGSDGKKILEDCHADAVMVLALDPKAETVDLVSLPRDTLVYVPGVKGIYKLNGAINSGGGSIEDGLEKLCDAASWVLGGVKIDYYCAVDMVTMVELGDAIGGVDFAVEMAYVGHSGKKYSKKMQHLDGIGIMDYLRSRTNATVNSNDIGRTGRQRELMLAIFNKLKNNPLLLVGVTQKAQAMQGGFFTNITPTAMLPYMDMALKINEQSVGSYVITGKYRTALQNWNFTFTDQKNRQAVIKKVYGIDVPPLEYVSYEYAKWLVDSGFIVVNSLAVAEELAGYIQGLDAQALTAEQREGVAAFEEAYLQAVRAFETAADSMKRADAKRMESARSTLREKGDAVAALVQYSGKLAWWYGSSWYVNPYINEAIFNWR